MMGLRWLRALLLVALGLFLVGVLATLSLFVYEPSLAEGFEFSSQGDTIRLSDGRTLAYLETGEPGGRPVFYFHGSPGSRLEGLLFDQLNRQLGIRLVAIDRPGYGLSDVQENRSYLDWPDDVSELADYLGISRFAVIGWSSGGPYAAVVAHQIPERIAVAAIVAGEGPYAGPDYPQDVLTSATFSGSEANRLMIWGATNAPWMVRAIVAATRVERLGDPTAAANFGSGFDFSTKDQQFFNRDFRVEYGANQVEAYRQGTEGAARDAILERLNWPFKLEEIHTPSVLMFYGDEDTVLHPGIGKYVCRRIPSCVEPMIYTGEGHSVLYYRYEEIIRSLLEAWQ